MAIRYPRPLEPGDAIGVTSPSSGVPDGLRPRLEFCLDWLRQRGHAVEVGACMDGAGVVSAPAVDRAVELTAMLTNPEIRAVIPPWGGELAVELLPHLDFEAIAASEPTWLVGYSDLSTLLLALTTTTGIAALHGQNLLDTPYRMPASMRSWTEVAGLHAGASFAQAASARHRTGGFDDWEADPRQAEYTFDAAGGWSLLDPDLGDLRITGRLIGGCIETVSTLAGTRYGDLATFARTHAPEGIIVYLEAAEDRAVAIARHLWRLRLAGWFDDAVGILIGRTMAPEDDGFTQRDAVHSALADLGLPVVLDVDCGHVPPHLALVNGALAELTLERDTQTLLQHLT